jgi:hypothetical protein
VVQPSGRAWWLGGLCDAVVGAPMRHPFQTGMAHMSCRFEIVPFLDSLGVTISVLFMTRCEVWKKFR